MVIKPSGFYSRERRALHASVRQSSISSTNYKPNLTRLIGFGAIEATKSRKRQAVRQQGAWSKRARAGSKPGSFSS